MDKINKKWICPSRIHLLHNPFSSPSIEKLCTSSKIKSAGMIYARGGKIHADVCGFILPQYFPLHFHKDHAVGTCTSI